MPWMTDYILDTSATKSPPLNLLMNYFQYWGSGCDRFDIMGWLRPIRQTLADDL